MSSEITCSKCGMKLPPNSRFCGGCGNRIEAAAPAPAPAAEPKADTPVDKSAAGVAAAPGGEKYICPGCGKLPSGNMANALGRMWHVACFKCTACGKPISGPFNADGLKPYCQPCFQEKLAPKCAKCGKVITSGMLVANEKSYHNDCFVCSKCGVSVKTGYKMRDGELFCATCK